MNNCLDLFDHVSHHPGDDSNTFLVQESPVGSAFYSQAHN